MFKTTLLVVAVVATFLNMTSAYSVERVFTARTKISSYKATRLSDLALNGLKYLALEKAHKACKAASFQHCQFINLTESSSSQVIRFIAKVKGISFPQKTLNEWHNLSVDINGWANTTRFSSLEINGIKMATFEAALKECEKVRYWDYCTLVDVKIKNRNKRTYVNEWNKYAYGAEAVGLVKGIRFKR